jgi:hypothetical protein
MDNGDRAEIGEFPEGQSSGGAESTEAPGCVGHQQVRHGLECIRSAEMDG